MKRRRIPHVAQLEVSDCGAACLAMVLAYHGCHVPLDELREATGADRDGVDARALVAAARRYGLDAEGVTADIGDLARLPSGSVLHWEFRHFVVLERVRGDTVHIVDPAMGRRRLPLAACSLAYTGVAVVCRPADGFSRSRRPRHASWRYLRPLLDQSGAVARILAASALIRVAALALPVLTGLVVDEIAPRHDRHLLVVVAGAMAFVVVYDLLGSLVRSRLLLHLRTRLDAHLTTAFVDHLLHLPYGYFLRRSAGDVIMRVQSNTEVREILTTGTVAALLDGGLAVLYLGVLMMLSPPLAVIALALGAVQVLVLVGSWRPTQDRMATNLEAEARTQSYVYEVVSGIETVKASGAEERAARHWERLFAHELASALARGRLNATVESLVGTLRVASPLGMLVYGAAEVLDGRMSLGTMLAAASLAGAFLEPLVSLVETGLDVSLVRSYMDRINDVLDAPREQVGAAVPAPRLRGEVRAEHVTFAYGPLAVPVVDDVSFAVHPGQRLGIVGRSGAGKSTLAHLLVGLCRPTAGRVLLDGADLGGLDLGGLRRQLGVVPQRAHVFGTTIREAIAFGDQDLPPAAVVRAAELAGIDGDIDGMPMGYDTFIGHGGAALSGGQRQRLALARALATRPSILLLDEATSDLDTVTERMVLANLRALGCTTIVIAHRLCTIADADLIIVLENGRVAEHGTHGDLVTRGGPYSQLVEAQERMTEA